eukprot:CAMPEP_0173082054 /NCGR_PEP_ID=MMETSP1102-20130122/17881_1 /TAXON_ID=49646 /ORGANISM="Geminigera sp., Strain Caron Lab Isolate" /LENGTH=64 /DNA_ID=CAMNT_0013957235 /DNA_START=697 /DNA_END=889 /DNA_ORIENTATION=+
MVPTPLACSRVIGTISAGGTDIPAILKAAVQCRQEAQKREAGSGPNSLQASTLGDRRCADDQLI